jgi:hypothetical protein
METNDPNEFDTVYHHFLKSLETPFRINNSISAHLDDPILKDIYRRWSQIKDPHVKAGFLMSLLPAKRMITLKDTAEKVSFC